jgi:DNA repair photolyase
MPGIVPALAHSGTPFSVLTKGTLLRRDLPLIAEAAGAVPVDLAMSIAIYDDDLQQAIEPGTPSTKSRLATVTAIRDLGLECSVFVMPILPYLTDTREHLDRAMQQAAAAGASSVLYSALHLRTGSKEWFMHWLASAHPELVERYASMYGKGAYAPKAYREWLAARIRPFIRRHGLDRRREIAAPGGVHERADASVAASRARAAAPTAAGPASLLAQELPPALALRMQPTLF